MGVKVRDIHRQVEKKHIFTHITWEMRGIYMEVAEPGGENLFWIPEQRIDAEFALPTAYRQFWEDRYV
jgi:A/G-specific adenine glycosylase